MTRVGLFTGAVAVTLFMACRDTQTDKEVTTRTSSGEAAVSMSGDSADKRGIALVRVVNAVPGQTRLVVRADRDHQLTAAEYRKVTDYQPIDRNWVTFEIGTSGDSVFTPLATNREMLTDGHRCTVVVMRDSAKNYETRVLRDEISDDTTAARIRVVHAARGVDEVNVLTKSTAGKLESFRFDDSQVK